MTSLGYIHWNPDPVIVSIGTFQPKWYGVLFVTGFALGYLFFKKEAVKQHIPIEKIDALLFMVLGFSILGARLVHVIFYDWARYQANPIDILKIWEGGLASHGGGLGMWLATWIWCRYVAKGQNMWTILDLIAVPTPLAGAFIRLGNLWNSEIRGNPTDLPWAFVFGGEGIPRHPVQLYEAICYILGSLILYLVYRKMGLQRKGLLLGLFLLVIFIPRFFMEFFKAPQDDHGLWLGILNTGQKLSIPFIVAGAVIVIFALRKRKAGQS